MFFRLNQLFFIQDLLLIPNCLKVVTIHLLELFFEEMVLSREFQDLDPTIMKDKDQVTVDF